MQKEQEIALIKGCNVLFFGHGSGEPIDKHGCIRPSNDYHEWHLFKDENGNLVEWKDDDMCNCGCWNTEDYQMVCKLYRKLPQPPPPNP